MKILRNELSNLLKMKIVKHSGAIVNFNRSKLKQSLLKSGATPAMVDDVLQLIEKEFTRVFLPNRFIKWLLDFLKKLPIRMPLDII